MEKIENKMVEFKNHRRFSFRYLSKDIIPVSVRLKSNIKAPKGNYIVRKAERVLLNERVRLINNSITMSMYQRGTCIDPKLWRNVINLSRSKGNIDI